MLMWMYICRFACECLVCVLSNPRPKFGTKTHVPRKVVVATMQYVEAPQLII
jgi:hypothetical protein